MVRALFGGSSEAASKPAGGVRWSLRVWPPSGRGSGGRRYRLTWLTCAVDVDRPRACDHVGVRSGVPAAAWAEQQVAAVRDDSAGRITLMERCYYGPFGKAPRHLPFRRAAMAFMRWQLQRGVLQPPFSDRPGSPWWRAVNERILRDGCEAVGLSGSLPGPASSRTVDYWMSFADYPIARAWYRAHNGSVPKRIRPPCGFRDDRPEVAAALRVVSTRTRSAGPT